MKKICVFGTYKNLVGKEKEAIVGLGRYLAENGAVVVSGGFGGIMEDVSRGAKSAGGKTIGVTYYKDRNASGKSANPFVDDEIATADIFERIRVMINISDGFIILQGGTGTLLELAAVLEHINKGMIPPKPIVAVGDFWKGAVDNLRREKVLNMDAKIRLNAEDCSALVAFVKDADEAPKKILSMLEAV